MTGDDQTRPDASNAIETTARHTRRRFLKAGMATAGALAIGSAGVASGRQQICNSDYGTIDVASAFTLMDNRWGMKDAQQCIWLNEDGTYGYDFDASSTSGGINYPEVFVGTRPWGDSTGVPEFPIRRGDVNDLVMDVEADVSISGGEWDWAEEWWLCTEDPTVTPETHQYEIMLLLDWGGGHDHGAVEDQNAWTDRFGNTVSLWTVYNSGGTSATFYIFRIEGGHDGGKIDMAEIERYLTQNEGISEDLLISGLELGNEYWSGAVGSTTYRQFDVTVNGSTYTSGPGGSTSSTTTAADTTTQTTTSEQTTQTTTQQSGDAIAAIDPETTTPAVGEYVDFYITDLTGGDRWITDLAWTLGDGTTGTGWHAGHAYSAAGEYVVELTATANDGTTSVDTVTVTVGSGSSAEQTTTQTTEQT
ncbi:MAG: PKD domain-containing protein, partial [Halococcoides sp.]